ncbi:MAG: hypothetical protein OQK99_05800 [Gammaproteobacteria bacterium]|nr:hypothetical protein [Gammaproteobacteria bacterium]
MAGFLQRAPGIVVWTAYACFAVRIVVPAGYMPAPLSSGAPFMLCHGGFEGRLLSALNPPQAHHHDHSSQGTGEDPDKQNSHAAWTLCPIGALFSSFAVGVALPALAPVDFLSDPPESLVKKLVAIPRAWRQQIRAPPSLS